MKSSPLSLRSFSPGSAYERLNPPVTYPPGILIPDDPVNPRLRLTTFHSRSENSISPRWRISRSMPGSCIAKHIATHSQAALVPVDLAVGWGPMSDQAVLDQLRSAKAGVSFLRMAAPAPARP